MYNRWRPQERFLRQPLPEHQPQSQPLNQEVLLVGREDNWVPQQSQQKSLKAMPSVASCCSFFSLSSHLLSLNQDSTHIQVPKYKQSSTKINFRLKSRIYFYVKSYVVNLVKIFVMRTFHLVLSSCKIPRFLAMQHSMEKVEVYSHLINISWKHLLLQFSSKNTYVAFTKILRTNHDTLWKKEKFTTT